MLRLSPDKIKTLSERLRERGAPPSMARPGLAEDPETEMLLHEYGPLCEVMFLAMSADGVIEDTERDVIRGALRELDERIHTPHLAEMLRRAEEKLEAEGQFDRLAALGREFDADPVRGEVGYVLASAIIYANDEVSMEENAFLNDLAEALGIDEARTEELQRLLL